MRIDQNTNIYPNIAPANFVGPEWIVSDWLQTNGFLVGNSCYHQVLPELLVSTLQSRYSPTAMTIRHRADRIAVHQTLPVEFLVEIKSPAPGHYANMLIEMFPLAQHVLEAREIGCDCLYAYVDEQSGMDAGFWCSELPEIARLIIPSRWVGERRCWFETIASRIFPGLPISYSDKTRGSGDPFVIIAQPVVDAMKDWRELVWKRMKEI